jgi:hypothetical protein
MDIISFWKNQTDIWNTQNKCGLCWEFSAPLVASQINIVQNETCCVNVFLTDIKFREEKVFNSVTGLTTSKRCIWNFSLYALIKENLGVNNYNEIKGHPVNESKWETIFYPIINCLGCDNLLDICNIQINQNGDAQLIHNYLDENYNGWKINYTFSEIT